MKAQGEPVSLIFTESAETVKKAVDSDGSIRWDFIIETDDYGKLVCSFYPREAQCTLRKYFKMSFLTSDWYRDEYANEEELEAAAKNLVHPVPSDQFEYATTILQEQLPSVLKAAVRQAIHEAVARTLADLDGKRHRLLNTTRKDLFKLASQPAIKAAKERLDVKRGRLSKSKQNYDKTRRKARRFKAQAIKAIKDLEIENERPSKANVARKLNLGSEKSRTQSLNNQLERHKVTWDELFAGQ